MPNALIALAPATRDRPVVSPSWPAVGNRAKAGLTQFEHAPQTRGHAAFATTHEVDRMNYLNFLATYRDYILGGVATTAWIYVVAATAGSVMAVVIALLRLSPSRILRWIAAAYIEIFRGTPLLVQMFWFYYVLPLFGVHLDKNFTGILCLGLSMSSYGAAAVRGAIESVPRGQFEVSIALNLTPARRMWRIILPQAVLLVLPTWGNLLVEYLKYSALVSLISIHDLMFRVQQINSNTSDAIAAFGTALLLYYLVSRFVIIPSFRMFEKSWAKRMGVA